jgi:hypothetical protein
MLRRRSVAGLRRPADATERRRRRGFRLMSGLVAMHPALRNWPSHAIHHDVLAVSLSVLPAVAVFCSAPCLRENHNTINLTFHIQFIVDQAGYFPPRGDFSAKSMAIGGKLPATLDFHQCSAGAGVATKRGQHTGSMNAFD